MSHSTKCLLLLQMGIANRDIKLENTLLMDESERPLLKLCDFGYSKDEYQGSACKTLCGELQLFVTYLAQRHAPSRCTYMLDSHNCLSHAAYLHADPSCKRLYSVLHALHMHMPSHHQISVVPCISDVQLPYHKPLLALLKLCSCTS